jgi:hypothetical protein
MSNSTKGTDRVAVLNTVQTPLGVIVLALVILDTVLTATAVLTDRISLLVPLAVIVFIVLLVSFIAVKWPWALYHPRDRVVLSVTLLFRKRDPANLSQWIAIEPIDVDLDVTKCKLDIFDYQGRARISRTPSIIVGSGTWYLQLMGTEIGPDDSVSIELVEHNGQMWRIKPFLPYGSDQRATLVS